MGNSRLIIRFTGANVVDFTYSIFFNTFFTIAPTILVGVFDQDLSAKMSLKVPQIYLKGIRQKLFRTERMWIYIAHGIWDSLVLFFGILLVTSEGSFNKGQPFDYLSVSTMMAYGAIFAINIFATTNWSTWNYITRFAFYVSIGFWVVYTLIYYSVADSIAYGTTSNVLNSASFYLVFFLSVAMCLLPKFIIKFTQQSFYPSDTDLLRESQAESKKIGIYELEEADTNSTADSSKNASSGHTTDSTSPVKSKIYQNSTDGFEGEPEAKSPTDQWPITTSPLSSFDASNSHNRASSIQQVFQKGVYFFTRMKNEPKIRPKINPRSSSIVYMNGKSREGVANTGFAFSQEPGMQDIITPNRSNIEDDKSSLGRTTRFSKLRNISNSIQSMFGMAISRSVTPIIVQDKESIDPVPNLATAPTKDGRTLASLSRRQKQQAPKDIDDDESSSRSRRSVNSDRSSPTRQLPFIPERGQK